MNFVNVNDNIDDVENDDDSNDENDYVLAFPSQQRGWADGLLEGPCLLESKGFCSTDDDDDDDDDNMLAVPSQEKTGAEGL